MKFTSDEQKEWIQKNLPFPNSVLSVGDKVQFPRWTDTKLIWGEISEIVYKSTHSFITVVDNEKNEHMINQFFIKNLIKKGDKETLI